ncbi:MAG: hypothetical protein AMS27_16970 [Bacteroides sp. SM23_62_1]|nr:MAG: hypothetical protein AMS27_16970 [Bacteroides sp. SM23_62_1]
MMMEKRVRAYIEIEKCKIQNLPDRQAGKIEYRNNENRYKSEIGKSENRYKSKNRNGESLNKLMT